MTAPTRPVLRCPTCRHEIRGFKRLPILLAAVPCGCWHAEATARTALNAHRNAQEGTT